jgi:hypothetical protein
MQHSPRPGYPGSPSAQQTLSGFGPPPPYPGYTTQTGGYPMSGMGLHPGTQPGPQPSVNPPPYPEVRQLLVDTSSPGSQAPNIQPVTTAEARPVQSTLDTPAAQ